MPSRFLPRPLPGLCLVLCVASAFTSAAAGEQAKSPSNDLPGVEGDYRIVKPLEPEPDVLPETGNSTKIGNFDVRVSGFVRAEAGFGNEFELKKK